MGNGKETPKKQAKAMGFVCQNNLWFICEPRTPFQKKLNGCRWMSEFVPDVFHLHKWKKKKRGQGVKGFESQAAIITIIIFSPSSFPIRSPPQHCAALMFKHWLIFGLHSHFFEWCSFRNTPWERSGSNIFKPFADFLTNSSNFLMRRHFQTNLLKDCTGLLAS